MNAPTLRRCACLNRDHGRCHNEAVQWLTLSDGFGGGQEILICKTHLRLYVRQGIVPRVSVAFLHDQKVGAAAGLGPGGVEGKAPPAEPEAPVTAAPSRAKERPTEPPAPVVKVRSRHWAQLDWCGAV
ncbi:hypothetical protein [Methylococcus sp. Mc7]|uniref:hypothetical protein n=1 Tax=Methylococcus sp. Mc7 TaxID=2860258 RepID=UPI001C52EA2A|nr:hypothetical protein [Methylococcus sp. Mc7]QXP85478.1 hypothetical protein KW115_07145 [Methylococcus sp. Mc7]